MAVSSATAVQAGTEVTALSRTRLAENFDTFLTLLTTQLKNQDPLSPMDSNQFTQQMVQMTGVEQQLLTNDLLKKLVDNNSSGINTAVSLIGKEIRAVSDQAALSGGQAKWIYKLDREADDLKVEVLDANGRVVKAEAPAAKGAGDHAFTWDGKGANGVKLPDGTYTLRVTAKDAAGKAVPSTSYIQGVVTGVEQANGDTLITMNGGRVSWEKITSIAQPPAPKTADNSNPSGTGDTDPDDAPNNPAG